MKKNFSHPPWLFPLSLFVLGFAFAMFLLQNLPFTFGDDLNDINLAKQTPWPVLLRGIVNPFIPVWYVHGIDALLATRPFGTALFKALYQSFGYSPNAFWALKAFGYAATGTLIFFFLVLSTHKKWIATLGSLFFLLLPPVYQTVSWIADTEILAQFAIVMAFLLFFATYACEKKTRAREALPWILGLVVSAWLGMKTRDTPRIIPFVLLGFLVLHQNLNLFKWVQSSGKNKLLSLATLFLFLPAVPWRKPVGVAFDAHSDATIFQINFSQLSYLAAHLTGIVSGVFLVAGAAFFVLLFFAQGRKEIQTEKTSTPGLFLFLALWSGAFLAGFTLNFPIVDNLRYLTVVLIPLILLGFATYEGVSSRLRGRTRKCFHFGLLLFVAVSLQRNLDEIIFIRNFHDGFDIADYLLTKKIYEDRFQVRNASWSELDDFRQGKGLAELSSRQIKIKDWDGNVEGKLKRNYLEEVASREGTVYVLSFDRDRFPHIPQMDLIYQTTTDNHSLYSWMLPKIKKKTHRSIFLYKYH